MDVRLNKNETKGTRNKKERQVGEFVDVSLSEIGLPGLFLMEPFEVKPVFDLFFFWWGIERNI